MMNGISAVQNRLRRFGQLCVAVAMLAVMLGASLVPVQQAAAAPSAHKAQVTARTICVSYATLRDAPGGNYIGDLFYGDQFNYHYTYDGVWAYGFVPRSGKWGWTLFSNFC